MIDPRSITGTVRKAFEIEWTGTEAEQREKIKQHILHWIKANGGSCEPESMGQ